jgi:hypothetical protein
MAGEEEYTRFENDLQARLDVVGAQLGDVHAKFRDAVQRRDRVELALLDQARPLAVHPGRRRPPTARPSVHRSGPLRSSRSAGWRGCSSRSSSSTATCDFPRIPRRARPRVHGAPAGPVARPPAHSSARPQDFVTLTKTLGKSKGHVSAKEAEAALKMVESRPVRPPCPPGAAGAAESPVLTQCRRRPPGPRSPRVGHANSVLEVVGDFTSDSMDNADSAASSMALVGSAGDDDAEIAALMRRFGMDDAGGAAQATGGPSPAASAPSAGAGAGAGGGTATGALDLLLPSVPLELPGRGAGVAPATESAPAADKMPEGVRLLMG